MLDDTTNLRSLLKDPSLLATQGYLAGDWVDGEDGATFKVLNPVSYTHLTLPTNREV